MQIANKIRKQGNGELDVLFNILTNATLVIIC